MTEKTFNIKQAKKKKETTEEDSFKSPLMY